MIAIVTPKIAAGMVQQVKRGNTKRDNILSVYYKAIEMVSKKGQWYNGETAVLYEGMLRGRTAKIWIKNESGWLRLVLFREGPNGARRLKERFYSKPLHIGVYKADQGWVTIINDNDYLTWHKETNRALEAQI